MANDSGAATYDYTADQNFLKAPEEQQHAYLSTVDPAYAKAPPQQQQAYRQHISQHVPTEAEAGAYPLAAPQPLAGAIREKGRIQNIGAPSELTGTAASPSEDAETAGLTSTAASLGINPVGTIGSIAGGAVGAPLMSSGARRVTGALGGGQEAQNTAGTIGGYTGLLGGGLLGGMGGSSIEIPDEATIGGIKFKNPFRQTEFPSRGTGAPEPSRTEFEANQAKDLMDQGKLVKLPNRVKPPFEQKLPLPQRAYSEMEGDILQGRQGRAAARDTAYNDLAAARNARRGGPAEGEPTPEGSSQPVTRIPEPNKPAPGENPNNQQSVKRRTTLVQNAKRGKEGAGTQLNQIQGPILYEPKGAGYSGVRESIPIPADTIGKGPVGAAEKPFNMEEALKNETNKEMSKPGTTTDRRQNHELRQAIDKLKDSPNEALQHFQNAIEQARKTQK